MKFPFTQTVTHIINSNISSDFFAKLPEKILSHTNLEYSCQQRVDGCFLKPTFKNMPYRNSFVPEINIIASCHDSQTTLHISGQPVKFVRVFMAFWFSFWLLFEVLEFVLLITSKDSIFPALATTGFGVFGYLLCELATKATFRSVVKAIKKECS